jgi:hypothetical protein
VGLATRDLTVRHEEGHGAVSSQRLRAGGEPLRAHARLDARRCVEVKDGQLRLLLRRQRARRCGARASAERARGVGVVRGVAALGAVATGLLWWWEREAGGESPSVAVVPLLAPTAAGLSATWRP